MEEKTKRVVRSPGIREFQAMNVGEFVIFGGKAPALSATLAKLKKKLGREFGPRKFQQQQCLVVLEDDVFKAILVQRTK